MHGYSRLSSFSQHLNHGRVECDAHEKVTSGSANKAAQRRRHQKSKTGVSVFPQKGLTSFFFFKKRSYLWNILHILLHNESMFRRIDGPIWDQKRDYYLVQTYFYCVREMRSRIPKGLATPKSPVFMLAGVLEIRMSCKVLSVLLHA